MLASKFYAGGGGGGSTDISLITPGTLKPFDQYYQKGFESFTGPEGKDPLLRAESQGALDFWKQLPGLIAPLQAMYKGMPDLYNALPGAGRIGQYEASYNQNVAPIIASGGAVTPEDARRISQQTRELADTYGTGRQLGSLGNEIVNTQQEKERRFGLAQQWAQGLQGLEQGVAQGRLGTAANIGNFAAQQQGLQSGGLNQLISVMASRIGSYVPLAQLAQNPVLANLQAQVAQAQINAAQNQASQNKMGGAASGAVSMIGSVAAAY